MAVCLTKGLRILAILLQATVFTARASEDVSDLTATSYTKRFDNFFPNKKYDQLPLNEQGKTFLEKRSGKQTNSDIHYDTIDESINEIDSHVSVGRAAKIYVDSTSLQPLVVKEDLDAPNVVNLRTTVGAVGQILPTRGKSLVHTVSFPLEKIVPLPQHTISHQPPLHNTHSRLLGKSLGRTAHPSPPFFPGHLPLHRGDVPRSFPKSFAPPRRVLKRPLPPPTPDPKNPPPIYRHHTELKQLKFGKSLKKTAPEHYFDDRKEEPIKEIYSPKYPRFGPLAGYDRLLRLRVKSKKRGRKLSKKKKYRSSKRSKGYKRFSKKRRSKKYKLKRKSRPVISKGFRPYSHIGLPLPIAPPLLLPRKSMAPLGPLPGGIKRNPVSHHGLLPLSPTIGRPNDRAAFVERHTPFFREHYGYTVVHTTK